MSLMTSWLSREQEDFHMGDDDIPHIPKTATIPSPEGKSEFPAPVETLIPSAQLRSGALFPAQYCPRTGGAGARRHACHGHRRQRHQRPAEAQCRA